MVEQNYSAKVVAVIPVDNNVSHVRASIYRNGISVGFVVLRDFGFEATFTSRLEEDLFTATVFKKVNQTGYYSASRYNQENFLRDLVNKSVLDSRYRKLCRTHMVWIPKGRDNICYRKLPFISSEPKSKQLLRLRHAYPGVEIINTRFAEAG